MTYPTADKRSAIDRDVRRCCMICVLLFYLSIHGSHLGYRLFLFLIWQMTEKVKINLLCNTSKYLVSEI